MRLRPPKKESAGHQEKIIAPGDMLIFVSGHHPIYGTQMLYFFDPILRSRAEIPPPTNFIPFTTEAFRPKTHSRTWPLSQSRHQDHTHGDACTLHPAVALAQQHCSTSSTPADAALQPPEV